MKNIKKTILSILFSGAFAVSAYASISVSGSASVSAEADMAIISATIRTSDENIRVSLEEQEVLIAQITESLEELGVTRITSSGFNIWENFGFSPSGESQQLAEINNSLSIIVEDLELLNDAIYLIASRGASNLHLTFDTSNRQHYEEIVLELAIQNAERRASTISRILGRSLGQNITVADDSVTFWGHFSVHPRIASYQTEGLDLIQHSGEVIIGTTIRMIFE